MHDELSTPLAVRDAVATDVPQLVTLINALNIHEGLEATMTDAHAAFVLFSPQRPVPVSCIVATRQREVIGFVLYYPGYDTASTSFGYHIADIFVALSQRTKGVGRLLMQEVATRCLHSGGAWCSLTTASANMDAAAFYDALHFHAPQVVFRAIGPKGLSSLL